MTTCLGKICSFGLLCVSFVNVYHFYVCPSFPFGFEGWMWDLTVLIPDHCLSIYVVIVLSTRGGFEQTLCVRLM